MSNRFVQIKKSKRLLDAAKQVQGVVDELGLRSDRHRTDPSTFLEQFDELITDPDIRAVSRELFEIQHYARAVGEAFKCLNNAVKLKAGLPAQDGAGLMRSAFSANEPVLALNALSSTSEEDEQKGYMDIFAGAMTGVRNPRAHEHDLEDQPEVALELLTLANHLMRRLRAAIKRR